MNTFITFKHFIGKSNLLEKETTLNIWTIIFYIIPINCYPVLRSSTKNLLILHVYTHTHTSLSIGTYSIRNLVNATSDVVAMPPSGMD